MYCQAAVMRLTLILVTTTHECMSDKNLRDGEKRSGSRTGPRARHFWDPPPELSNKSRKNKICSQRGKKN
jgi:hypothetical protein